MIATTSHPTVEVGIARGPMAKVLLVGAPLLMAVARALLVPLHDSDWDATMTAMVQNREGPTPDDWTAD